MADLGGTPTSGKPTGDNYLRLFPVLHQSSNLVELSVENGDHRLEESLILIPHSDEPSTWHHGFWVTHLSWLLHVSSFINDDSLTINQPCHVLISSISYQFHAHVSVCDMYFPVALNINQPKQKLLGHVCLPPNYLSPAKASKDLENHPFQLTTKMISPVWWPRNQHNWTTTFSENASVPATLGKSYAQLTRTPPHLKLSRVLGKLTSSLRFKKGSVELSSNVKILRLLGRGTSVEVLHKVTASTTANCQDLNTAW